MTLTRILSVLCILVFAACSGDSDEAGLAEEGSAAGVTYVVVVTAGDSDTTIALVSYTDNGTDAPTAEELRSVSLGWGLLPFMASRGTVPTDRTDLPDACRSGRPLGPDDAFPCWLVPVLQVVAAVAESGGVGAGVPAVTALFSGDDSESDDGQAALALDAFIPRAAEFVASRGFLSGLDVTPDSPDRAESPP